jgi:hypothetical protein
MNPIFMQNMHYQMNAAVTMRYLKEAEAKSINEVTRAYLLYILQNGKATGMQLRKYCSPNYVLPSMALRQHVRSGSLLFTPADGGNARSGTYSLEKGITAYSLGIDE